MQGSRERWRAYYRRTADRPPRDTLLTALAAWESGGNPPGRALDLGCGAGRDTLELLRRGWRVVALDAEAAALEALQSRASARGHPNLECRTARIETLDPLPQADLINAGFCLFLLAEADFERTWAAIRRALAPGGLFCGQLLGPEDDWAGQPGLTVQDAPSLAALLCGYRALLNRQERSAGPTPKGGHKAWHLHHLVLQRRPDAPDWYRPAPRLARGT